MRADVFYENTLVGRPSVATALDLGLARRSLCFVLPPAQPRGAWRVRYNGEALPHHHAASIREAAAGAAERVKE